MTFIDYFNLVPDVVYAAVIASLLTILGVILTNRGNNNRLLEQLRHDSMHREREREMSLKRDILLPAIDEMSRGLRTLHKIISIDYKNIDKFDPIDAYSQFNKDQDAIGRLFIISNEDTIKAVTQLNEIHSKINLRLLVLKTKVLKLTMLTDMCDDFIEKDKKKMDNIEEMLKNDIGDKAEKQKKEGELREIKEKITSDTKNMLKRQRDMAKVKIDFLIRTMNDVFTYSKWKIPVYICLRKELEMPIDEEYYKKVMTESIDKANTEFNEMIKDIEETFKVFLGDENA